jgi:hypothetical protein
MGVFDVVPGEPLILVIGSGAADDLFFLVRAAFFSLASDGHHT